MSESLGAIVERMNGMDMKPRLCVDCRWHEPETALQWFCDRCVAPQNIAPADPVRGNPQRKWVFCSDARYHDCGPTAAWFEPKPIRDVPANSAELVDGLNGDAGNG